MANTTAELPAGSYERTQEGPVNTGNAPLPMGGTVLVQLGSGATVVHATYDPMALMAALETQKLNLARELGFTPPSQTTR